MRDKVRQSVGLLRATEIITMLQRNKSETRLLLGLGHYV